jgi:hypothetical protein
LIAATHLLTLRLADFHTTVAGDVDDASAYHRHAIPWRKAY